MKLLPLYVPKVGMDDATSHFSLFYKSEAFGLCKKLSSLFLSFIIISVMFCFYFSNIFFAWLTCVLFQCFQLSPLPDERRSKSIRVATTEREKNITKKIGSLKQLSCWERLKRLKLYCLERRRGRYTVMYIWKIHIYSACIRQNKGLPKFHSLRIEIGEILPPYS